MDQPVILRSQRKWSLRLPVGLAAALLAGLGSYAYADFGAAQGGGGGGAAQTPWTAAIDAAGYALSDVGNVTIDGTTVLGDGAADTVSLGSTNRLAFGGSTSTYPAFRYGSSAGVVEMLRADGSAGSVRLKATHADGIDIYSDNNSGYAIINDTQATHGFVAGGTFSGTNGTANMGVGNDLIQVLDGETSVYVDNTQVAYVGSRGVVVTAANGLQLGDVTSAPTVTAGYTGLYSLNTGGRVDLTAVVGGQTRLVASSLGRFALQLDRTSNQTITTGAGQAVTWQTATLDPRSLWVSGSPTKVVTASSSTGTVGWWQFSFSVLWDNYTGTTGYRQISCDRFNSSDAHQDGQAFRAANDGGGGDDDLYGTVSFVTYMNDGDYVTANAAQTTGGDLALVDGSGYSIRVRAVWLGP